MNHTPRSLYARCRREARRWLGARAYVDRRLGESVNTASKGELVNHLFDVVGGVDWRVVDGFHLGEVLSDGRGGGSSQVLVVPSEKGWRRRDVD